jgi:arsenate reductase
LGLPLVVFGLVRRKNTHVAPIAVGAYITGAYFFTSSTSFANPAFTLARMLSDTFAGIATVFQTRRYGLRRARINLGTACL